MGVLRRGGAPFRSSRRFAEMGINVTSAARDVSDIGLGAMLGSTVLVIPVIVTTAYLATRKGALKVLTRSTRSIVVIITSRSIRGLLPSRRCLTWRSSRSSLY